MVSRVIVTVNRFWSNLPLRAKALALVWFPLPVVFVAGVMMYRAERSEQEGRTRIEHTLDVRGDIQNVTALLLDAEASAREFAANREAQALRPYLRSRELLPVVSAHLGTLVRYEPEQSARWKEIEDLITHEFERLDELCRIAGAAQPLPERQMQVARLLDQGQRASIVLAVKLTAMEMEQDRLVQLRGQTGETVHFRPLRVLLEGAIVGIFCQMVATLLLAGTVTGQIRCLETNAQRLCQGLPQEPLTLDSQEIHALGKRLQDAALVLAQHGRELRDSEERFRTLFREAPIAYHETDRDGIIRHVNTAECALLGVEREALVGKHIWETVSEDSREMVRRNCAQRLAEYCPATPYECEYECADHSRVTVEVHENLIHDEQGGVCGIRSALLDVTARKMVTMASRKVNQYARELKTKNEELLLTLGAARAASATKGRFLAAMSHELRTPLNGIIGLTELMYDGRVGPVSEEHQEYLGDILASSRHLLHLVNEVLDLAKVESGKMEFRPEPVEITPLLHEVRDVLRILADRKSISIEVEVDDQVGTVVTDAARLKQVVYNYLSNAIKFTNEGGSIQMRARREVAGFYRLEIEDTGPGIEKSDLSRLFADFQRLDEARPEQGTGLGLALTKRIVEDQGGSVGVRSTPGVGSVFFAILPTRHTINAKEDPTAGRNTGPLDQRAAAFLSWIPIRPEIAVKNKTRACSAGEVNASCCSNNRPASGVI